MIKAHPATISDETLAAIRRNVNKAAEAQDRAAAGRAFRISTHSTTARGTARGDG